MDYYLGTISPLEDNAAFNFVNSLEDLLWAFERWATAAWIFHLAIKRNIYRSNVFRSRMTAITRAEESPDRGAAVPTFGEWDENNPQSADNYTHIFNKVREERHTGSSNAPGAKSDSSYSNMQKQRADNDPKGCCFPFFRK